MPNAFSEDNSVEKPAMILLRDRLGWKTYNGVNDQANEHSRPLGRQTLREVVLRDILLPKLKELNPGLPDRAYQQACDILTAESSVKQLHEINREKYFLLRDGIKVQLPPSPDGRLPARTVTLRCFDFDNPESNHFLAVNQLWVQGVSNRRRRPDIICFVNGIPLVYIELKKPAVNLQNAYSANFCDNRDTLPLLFHYNAFVLLSNGLESKMGSLTAEYHHFHEWKRISEDDEGQVDLDRIILGVCEKGRLLDLFRNFIVFDSSGGKVAKIIARNHQFIGVNKAIANVREKDEAYRLGNISLEEKQKLGVFWHTQGSGKSYSMVFFCEKMHRTFTGSYTFLIVTDRNELDKQIYGTFSSVGAVPQVKAASKDSLRASSGQHLRELLTTQNRYLFTLIHKFNFEDVITGREDIIVISDEAHRTQGGSLALNLRKALPGAAFMGFTGTPLFQHDEITRRIFGDYVSRYDFKRSVEDGATVPLFYENRGEKLNLKNPEINTQIRAALDEEAEYLDTHQRAKVERLFARDYPVLTAKKRLDSIAKDVVEHFCERGYKGKGMFIALDKLTAVKMHDKITAAWALYVAAKERELDRGGLGDQESGEKRRELQWIKETEICVVVSSEQGEVEKFRNEHLDIDAHREKMNTQDLEARFKDEHDPFRLVIVCAMWITGFDVPTLSTMYLDKPLTAHTLMQAIARANRVSDGKANGWIVDYIDTYQSLLEAMKDYGAGEKPGKGEETPGGSEAPAGREKELVAMLEKALLDVETYLLQDLNFDVQHVAVKDGLERLSAVQNAINAISVNDETKAKFEVMAREVFKLFNALRPQKIVWNYKDRRDAINAIYSAIQEKVQSADVSALMRRIQGLVDESVNTEVNEDLASPEKNIVDLSGLDIDLLRKFFDEMQHKNTAVQALKEMVEEKVKKMLARNPTMIDFYQRYQDIIEDYNNGKSEVLVSETFRKLIELVNGYTATEAEMKREGLTEEQQAIFDILREGKTLEKRDKALIKSISIDMLQELKAEKLKIYQWAEKAATAAAVRQYINNVLYENLPDVYALPEIETRTTSVYDHVRNLYAGGVSVPYASA